MSTTFQSINGYFDPTKLLTVAQTLNKARNSFFSHFPELTITQAMIEEAAALFSSAGPCPNCNEVAERLILLPDWNGAFGSYKEAMKKFHEAANSDAGFYTLADCFFGLTDKQIDLIEQHESIETKIHNNPSVPKLGNFFVLGVAFRYWRRGETSEKVLGTLLPDEVPASILDAYYVAYTLGLTGNKLNENGVGAPGDTIGQETGAFSEDGGQISNQKFYLTPNNVPLNGFISFFVPDVGKFRTKWNPTDEDWTIAPPSSWKEASEWYKRGDGYFKAE